MSQHSKSCYQKCHINERKNPKVEGCNFIYVAEMYMMLKRRTY